MKYVVLVLACLVMAACNNAGLDGVSGRDGVDGKAGTPGSRGEPGEQGPIGPEGWAEFPQPYTVTVQQVIPPGDPNAGAEGYLTVGCIEDSDILIGGGCSADDSYLKVSIPSPPSVFPPVWTCESWANVGLSYTLIARAICVPMN